MNKALINQRDLILKRLRFRSWHRGWKETDLVLGRFADLHMNGLEADQLEAYGHLLDENDADIWDWLVEKVPPTRVEYGPLLELLRKYTV